MSNPKGCSKKSLLLAVTELNNRCGTKLRVTSKTVAEIVVQTEIALQSVAGLEILRKLSPKSLGELCCWGLVSTRFFGEEEVPAFVKTALDSHDSETVLAKETLLWEETEAELIESKEVIDEEPVKLTKKQLKKLKKQAKKNKESGESPVQKEEDTSTDEEVTPEPEPEPLPSLLNPGDVKDLSKGQLKAQAEELNVDPTLKKKKLIKAVVIALIAAHAEREQTPVATKPKAKRKPSKRKGPGVIMSIKDILVDTKKPLNVEGILEKLTGIITNGDPEKMVKTIRAQICGKQPCRLEREKDCTITVDGVAQLRTFIIK